MRIEKEIEQFADYVDTNRLMELLSKPMEYLVEDVSAIIPSLNIGGDGLSLRSIFLISRNYLCEVRIMGGKREMFDFANKREIFNVRVELGNHDIVVDDQVVASYDTAEVTLLHREEVHTVLYYYGSDRSTWLAIVLKEFPLEYLRRNSNQ